MQGADRTKSIIGLPSSIINNNHSLISGIELSKKLM